MWEKLVNLANIMPFTNVFISANYFLLYSVVASYIHAAHVPIFNTIKIFLHTVLLSIREVLIVSHLKSVTPHELLYLYLTCIYCETVVHFIFEYIQSICILMQILHLHHL